MITTKDYHIAEQKSDDLLLVLANDEHWMVRAAAEAALKRRDVARDTHGEYWKLERQLNSGRRLSD